MRGSRTRGATRGRGTSEVSGAAVARASYACYNFSPTLRSVRTRHALLKQCAEFSVAKLQCSVEADRQLVEDAIAKRFGSHAAFEAFMHEELPVR